MEEESSDEDFVDVAAPAAEPVAEPAPEGGSQLAAEVDDEPIPEISPEEAEVRVPARALLGHRHQGGSGVYIHPLTRLPFPPAFKGDPEGGDDREGEGQRAVQSRQVGLGLRPGVISLAMRSRPGQPNPVVRPR